jgi:hypothetical protein
MATLLEKNGEGCGGIEVKNLSSYQRTEVRVLGL